MSAIHLLWAVFIAACAHAAEVKWTLSLGDPLSARSFELTKTNGPSITGTFPAPDRFTGYSDKAITFAPITYRQGLRDAMRPDQLPPILQNLLPSGVSVYALTPFSYQLRFMEDRPMFSYVGVINSSAAFVCTRTFESASADFQCTGGGATAQFTGSSDTRMGFQVTGPDATAVSLLEAEMVPLLLSRGQRFSNVLADAEWIADKSDSRRDKSRVAVGFLWFFVAVLELMLVALATLYAAWTLPLLRWTKSPARAHFLWAAVWVIWVIICAAAGGLLGFIVITIFLALFSLVVAVVYAVLRHKARTHQQHAIGATADTTPLGTQRQPAEPTPEEAVPIVKPAFEEPTAQPPVVAPQAPHVHLQLHVTKPVEEAPPPPYSDADAAMSGGPQSPTSPTAVLVEPVPEPGVVRSTPVVAFAAPPAPSFCSYPKPWGSRQLRLVLGCTLGLVVALVCCGIVFGAWTVEDYYVWERDVQLPKVEFMPQTVAKGAGAVYVFDGWANKLQLNNGFFQLSTEYCGTQYTETLSSGDKKKALYDGFIKKYDIDMSIYEPSDYMKYNTVNEWFARPLRVGARPVSSPNDPLVIVSPADARVMLFEDVPVDSDIWLKNEKFTARTLIGDRGYDLAQRSGVHVFDDGAMAIVRLAPQDYHRFHMPLTGTVVANYPLQGTLHSVNMDGMTSGNYAIYNQRSILLFRTDDNYYFAYIAIGATCVGSVNIPVPIGTRLEKGHELGWFAFGGSTVAVIFEKGSVRWDPDILAHTRRRAETLVKVNMRLGVRL